MAQTVSTGELRIVRSGIRRLGLGVIALLMALGAWWGLVEEAKTLEDRLVGWLAVVFFGLGGVVLLRQGLRGKQEVLRISPQGVWLAPRVLGKEEITIPWDEIAEVRAEELRVRWNMLIKLVIELQSPERLGLSRSRKEKLLMGMVDRAVVVLLGADVPRRRKLAAEAVELARRYGRGSFS